MNSNNRKPAYIIAVDDDPDDRDMIEMALSETKLPTRLELLQDGESLMQHLQDTTKPVPDMILLDINMPRMNGLEALRSIKEDPALKTIPVIMLTTSREEADVITSYRLGCNSFITKPNLYDSLVDLLKVLSEYWIDFVKHAPVQKAIDDTLGRD